MPSIPGSWIPTAAGSQLLYDLLDELCDIATPLSTGAAIQAALDSDRENGRPLVLAGQEITYTTSLDVDGGSGGKLFGMGWSDTVEESSDNARLASTLIYNGTKASNEYAIRHKRSEFGYWNMNIQGKSTADVIAGTGTRTPRGIYIVRDAAVGTGKIDMRCVRGSGFDVFIDSGDSLAAANCDESSYYDVYSYKNGTFYRSNNIQGLSQKFYNLRISHTDTVFDYIAGGKMAVTDCLITGAPTTLLQLRNDESTGFGPNGSRWVFRGVDLDSNSRNSKLLEIETGISYYAHVVYEGVHFARNGTDVWDNYAWHIGDSMHVTINDAHNLMAGMIKYTTTEAKSSVTINCGTSLAGEIATVEDLFDPASTGPSPMVIINNLMPNGGQTPLNFSDTL